MKHTLQRKEVTVQHPNGLQMISAGLLAKEAQKYQSSIYLTSNAAKADAKSVLDILTLAAGKGARLFIEAEGRDASTAVQHLSNLFDHVLENVPADKAGPYDHLYQAHL